jgi:hypothetical protein
MTTEIIKNASPRLPRPDRYTAHVEEILAAQPRWRRVKARIVLWVLDVALAIAYACGF